MIIITAEAVGVHNQLEKLDHTLASLQAVDVLLDALLELPQVSNYLLDLPQGVDNYLLDLAQAVDNELLDLAQALEQELLLLVEEGQQLEGVH